MSPRGHLGRIKLSPVLTYRLTVACVPTLAILWDRLSGECCLCGLWAMRTDLRGGESATATGVLVKGIVR